MKRKRDKPKVDVPSQCGEVRDGWVYPCGAGGHHQRMRADIVACKKKRRPRAS